MSEIQPNIRKLIMDRSRGDKKLYLSHDFRGMTLTHPVKLVEALPGDIIFQCHENVSCLTTKKRVFLRSVRGKKLIAARISDVDIRSGELKLSDLELITSGWKDRCERRIPPDRPLSATLHTSRYDFRGNVENISLQGARFLLHKSKDGKIPDNGIPIRLIFIMPDEIDMDIRGQIVHIDSEKIPMIVIGLRLFTSPKEKSQLFDYIQHSQTAIQAQINEACRKTFEPPQISDLYF